MQKPILCVDFDGVLHAYTSGWHGEVIIKDGPIPGAMAFLCEAVKHFEVHIYSSRSRLQPGREAMREAIWTWLLEDTGHPSRALKVYELLQFSHEKPAAFLTIDDRAVCFDGTFPDPVALLNFKPWNKREV